MSGDAREHAGVFILYFTLNQTAPEVFIIGGWSSRIAPRLGRIKCSVRHAERAKNLALAKSVETFVRNALSRYAENDEADVTIFRFRTRFGDQRRGQRCR